MSIVVGTLTIDLKANTASFSQSMDKMSALSGKTANDIKRSLERIATAGVAMATAIAGATTGLIVHALDTADAMDKMSQATGASSENLSVLAYAANLSNVSMEDLGKGLEKLAKSAMAAQGGNVELEKIFARLGVTTTDAQGHLRDTGAMMQDLAIKFAAMQDGAGKTALAMALFGKAGAGLIPLLNQYGEDQAKVNEEAHRFGLILSTSTTQLAGRAHDNLDRLHAVFKGMGFALLGATLPALEQLSTRLVDVARNANIPDLMKSFGAHVTTAIHAIGDALEFATKHAHALKVALEALAAVQVSRLALPFIADLASGGIEKAGAGILRFTTGLLGLNRVIPVLSQIAAWLKTEIWMVGALAAEEGIATAATYALNAAMLTNPYVQAAAAIAGVIVLLYKFRESTFSIRGETFQLRDTWNAAWLGMGKVFSWIGGEFSKMIAYLKGLWGSFITYIDSLPFVKRITDMFRAIVEWAGKILGQLGNLTPQWVVDLLREAKQQREAAAKPKPEAAPAPAAKPKPPAETAGLGQPKKDVLGDEIRKLNQAAIAEAAYISVLGASPEKIQAVTIAEKARALIVDINNKLIDEGRPKLSKHAEALLTQKLALAETLKALHEYGQAIVDQQHQTELAIAQARALADAELRGDEAVRQATANNAILALTYGKTAEQIRLMQPDLEKLRTLLLKKSNEEFLQGLNREVYQLNQEIEARRGIVPAILAGEDALRQADLAAKLYAIDQQIANTQDNAAREALEAKRRAVEAITKAEWDETDARDALRLRSPIEVYQEETRALERQIAVLTENGTKALSYGQALQVAAIQQQNWNRLIEETISKLLLSNRAIDGVKAFFLKMQQYARTTADIIYEALSSAFGKISDQLTELVTGGKTSFAKMFEDIGKQALNAFIKKELQEALAKIGKHFGIDLFSGKPDGSSAAKALWVKVVGAVSTAEKIPGLPGTGKEEGKDQTAPTKGPLDAITDMMRGLSARLGSIFSSLIGSIGRSLGSVIGSIGHVLGGLIPHAEGGPVLPTAAYLVGERGPEILTRTSGYITSAMASRRLLTASAGGPNITNYIDARGTDAALVEQRVRAATMIAHNSAVRTSFLAVQEHHLRTPR
jgi:Lambda phage tail tape-measure protein (Tape_meas_lam_C)